MTDDMDARSRVKRLEAALRYITSESGCEHFTTGLGSCYRSGKREDAEDWADKVCFPCKAHAALATPPPEGEPENDGCELCGRSPDEIADAGCCQIAPSTPEQAHGDALAALRFLINSSTADHQALRNADEVIRPYLTASGVPEDGFGVEDVVRWASWIVGTEGAAGCPTPSDRVTAIAHAVVNADQGEDDSDPLAESGVPERRLDDYEVRAALAEKEWITECARYETSKFGEWMCDWYSASAEADRRYENAIAAAPTDGREHE